MLRKIACTKIKIARLGAAAAMTAGLSLARPVLADTHPVAPALSSRVGAAYTIYLDFSGFNFSGNWGNNASSTPGSLAAYGSVASTGTFSSTQISNIENIWARVSQEYIGYNVNVTTVDPAVAAGQAATDLSRQNYYDATAQLMHTVITPTNWSGGGGISYVGVTPNSQSGSNGYHTDFVYPSALANSLQAIGQAASHENGHGMGLSHQSDYTGNTLINEYSTGTGTGAGSVAPVMGDSYSAQRGLWSVGTADTNNGGAPTTQNDAQIIANDRNNNFINDGVGHSITTPTALAVTGNTINFNTDKGVIVPASKTSPNPTGQNNYQDDFWSFHTSGGAVSIKANSGTEFLNAGTADPGSTLDALLNLYNSSGTLVASTPFVSGSLSNTIATSLMAGDYTLQVLNAANATDTNPSYTTRNFYDMGAYFLSGSIPIPDSPTLLLFVAGALLLVIRPSRRQRTCD